MHWPRGQGSHDKLRKHTRLRLHSVLDKQTHTAPATQLDALRHLFAVFSGAHWTNRSGWNTSTTYCNWHGVGCGTEMNATHTEVPVVSLQLGKNGLTGSLDDTLSIWPALPHLQTVMMHMNSLSGHLPYTLFTKGMQTLGLGENAISGEILPSVVSRLCPRTVHTLGIEHNKLSGTLPPALFDLVSLKRLTLGLGGLSGTLPHNIGNLTNCTNLGFDQHRISGTVPPSFYTLTSMVFISMDINRISGTIGPEIKQWSQAQILSNSFNRLSGTLTPAITDMPTLQQLLLGRNRMSGTIPTSVGKLTNLEIFDNDNNMFSGPLPSEFCTCTALYELVVGTNFHTGTLPSCLSSLPRFANVDFDNNLISGTVPAALIAMPSMFWLDVSGNRFSGSIDTPPSSAPRPSATSTTQLSPTFYLFNASYNRFQGTIPSFLYDLTTMNQLYLSGNQFSGTISERVGQLRALTRLHMADNLLSSSLPGSLQLLPDLTHLHLSNNRFSGLFPLVNRSNGESDRWPARVWEFRQMRSLLLGGNQFSGVMDADLSAWTKLSFFSVAGNQLSGSFPHITPNISVLSLSMNLLSGALPDAMSTWSRITALDVSFNRISGTIPAVCEHTHTQLRRLVLSSNSISGSLPERLPLLHSLSSVTLDLNFFSCGFPSTWTHQSVAHKLHVFPSASHASSGLTHNEGKHVLLNSVQLPRSLPATTATPFPRVSDGHLELVTGCLLPCPLPDVVSQKDPGAYTYVCQNSLWIVIAVATGAGALLVILGACIHRLRVRSPRSHLQPLLEPSESSRSHRDNSAISQSSSIRDKPQSVPPSPAASTRSDATNYSRAGTVDDWYLFFFCCCLRSPRAPHLQNPRDSPGNWVSSAKHVSVHPMSPPSVASSINSECQVRAVLGTEQAQAAIRAQVQSILVEHSQWFPWLRLVGPALLSESYPAAVQSKVLLYFLFLSRTFVAALVLVGVAAFAVVIIELSPSAFSCPLPNRITLDFVDSPPPTVLGTVGLLLLPLFFLALLLGWWYSVSQGVDSTVHQLPDLHHREQESQGLSKQAQCRSMLVRRMGYAVAILLCVAVSAVPNYALVASQQSRHIRSDVKSLIRVAVALFKASFVSVLVPRIPMWLPLPSQHRFSVATRLISVVQLVSTVMVPIATVLLVDERCFAYALRQPDGHTVAVDEKVCIAKDVSTNTCVKYNQEFYYEHVPYRFLRNPTCPSAIVETYGFVFVLALTVQAAVVPCWTLLRDSDFIRRRFGNNPGFILRLRPVLYYAPQRLASLITVLAIMTVFGLQDPLIVLAGTVTIGLQLWTEIVVVHNAHRRGRQMDWPAFIGGRSLSKVPTASLFFLLAAFIGVQGFFFGDGMLADRLVYQYMGVWLLLEVVLFLLLWRAWPLLSL